MEQIQVLFEYYTSPFLAACNSETLVTIENNVRTQYKLVGELEIRVKNYIAVYAAAKVIGSVYYYELADTYRTMCEQYFKED